MSRQVKLRRYKFDPITWGPVAADHQLSRSLANRFRSKRLYGPAGKRYGFINCKSSQGIVIGYFAQEGVKQIVAYDKAVNQSTQNVSAFAHILFVLDILSGSVALQQTRITGFEDLSLPLLRDNFPKAVREVLRSLKVQLPQLRLIQDDLEINSEQLYQVFLRYKTTSLTITNLSNRHVPSYNEFKIFNPRVDADKIYRGIFEEDIQNGLDKITLHSEGDENLNNTALARIGARVGEIQSLTVIPNKNDTKSITLKTSASSTFDIPVTSDNETQPLTAKDIAVASKPLTLRRPQIGGQAIDVALLMKYLRSVQRYFVRGNDDE